MTDRFFTMTACQRCGGGLSIRMMSWFTEQTICASCADKESELRAKLPNRGRDLEGCGYLPEAPKPTPVPDTVIEAHNDWHDEDSGDYECYVCGASISASDHHDNGACVSCVEDPESGFDRG